MEDSHSYLTSIKHSLKNHFLNINFSLTLGLILLFLHFKNSEDIYIPDILPAISRIHLVTCFLSTQQKIRAITWNPLISLPEEILWRLSITTSKQRVSTENLKLLTPNT